jgi:hypothetical protein
MLSGFTGDMKPAMLWVLSLLFVGAVSAVDYTVEAGEPFLIKTPAYSTERVREMSVDYRIPGTTFNHRTVENVLFQPYIEEQLILQLPPGTYQLFRRVVVNDRVTAQLRDNIIVVRKGELAEHEDPTETRTSRQTNRTTASTADQDRPALPGISISPIPDVEAGTSLLIPVTVSGSGTLPIQLPTLAIGTYETPSSITVDGTDSFVILLHIDEDAQPGTYNIPVRVGDEETTIRVRVIKFVQPGIPLWVILTVLGVIIFAILAVLFTQRRPPRDEPPFEPPRERHHSDDLITYY